MENNEEFFTGLSLSTNAAQNLAHSTKSVPMMEEITPRWLLTLLPWVSVEAGVYRVNKRKRISAKHGLAQFDKDKHAKVSPEHLCEVAPFKYISPKLIKTITPYFEMESYDKGGFVSKNACEGDKLFIVVKGKIQIVTEGARGEKVNIGILSDGDYFNIDAFIHRSNRPITMNALTQCTLFSLEREVFSRWLNESPDSLDEFNKALQMWAVERKQSNEYGEKSIEMLASHLGEHKFPMTYPDYEECPREYTLSTIQTTLRMNSRVSDIFNKPIDQLQEQMRLTIEAMRERQEHEILNNKEFGLINSVAPHMRVQAKTGVPTPDDMDELIARVWKKPAFFLAHPRAIAAFGRECTRRGVPPATINLYGSPFLTWRGIPILPSDKLLVSGKACHHSRCGTTNILLMRVGEKEQGVVGLHQPGIPDEKYLPSLSVKFGGIDDTGIISYLLSLYFSAACLTDDALGMLEDVEVGTDYDD